MKVLVILTSHNKLGDSNLDTGFWLEEFAGPYYYLRDADVHITLASPLGGKPPVDPKSYEPVFQTDATRRFEKDLEAQQKLASTSKLSDINPDEYDAVFYPGGHGPLWDLHNNTNSISLIEHFIASGKPVAAVCHAPAVLIKARNPDGTPLLNGKRVTGFSNSEEAAVGLTDVVPYLLEDELNAAGGMYSSTEDWHSLAIVDGLLITGQNPASSVAVAEALLKTLKEH